jgi:hypothetical protein
MDTRLPQLCRANAEVYMQGLLVGQVCRQAGCQFAHQGPPFASGRSLLQSANRHFSAHNESEVY